MTDRGRGGSKIFRNGFSVVHRRARRARAAVLLALAAGAFGVAALAASPAAMGMTALQLKLASDPYGEVYEYVPYGPSPEEVANVYMSAVPNSPTVILVHGGGWRAQGPLGRLHLQAMSLQSQGFTVVEINYDQDSPTVTAFPLEPNDVIEATRWAIANAGKYNANPGKVVLVGGSAGAQLVAAAAEKLDAASPGTVDGVVALSGPMNLLTLLPLVESNTITYDAFQLSVYQALGVVNEAATPAVRSYAAEWSPALHVPSANCPKWLIFNADEELIPLSQAQEMTANLQAAHCSAALGVVAGREHSFEYFRLVKPTVYSFIRGL